MRIVLIYSVLLEEIILNTCRNITNTIMSPSPKVVVQTFENYAKSQLMFMQQIAELATKPSYVEYLHENDVIKTVLPLISNSNPTVRMNVVLAIARLAVHSQKCARDILNSKNFLHQMFKQICKENKYYKKNCMQLIKNLCNNSPANSEILIKECGASSAILTCTNDFDTLVRESALQAICSIVHHDANLAHLMVETGVLPHIVLCLKDKQQSLKLCAISTLDQIAKHSPDLAHKVVEVPILPHIINNLSKNCTDIKVQRNGLILLKNIVKHSLFLAETVIEANLFPDVLLLMAHPDESIRHNSAKLICEIVKHSIQIAQMVVNAGGLASLMYVIKCSKDYSVTPAVITLGYISAMSPTLASAVIQSKVLIYLTAILNSDTEQYAKAGTIWTLGNIGQHSSEHSRSVCASGAITTMMDIYMMPGLENECRHKCKTALQLLLKECDDHTVLESLLNPSIPDEIMILILKKMSKILPKNAKARRSFITNGHLKMIQNLRPEIDSDLFIEIKVVNCCFPDDIIQMVAGNFPETVMQKVDKFVPQNQCLFYNNRMIKSEDTLSKDSANKLSSDEDSSDID